MADILYDAAIRYKQLENTIYKIVVGRKGKAYTIQLHFPPESFFHLAGLQHLTDITFPSKNKERIYKEILKRNLTLQDIQKSIFFDGCYIEERLNDFMFLEQLLDSNSVTYLINNKRYIQYTKIKSDYLCERNINSDIIYLFIVQERKNPKFENECKGCSLFTKHDINYTNGTSKTTTLLIEKEVQNVTYQIFKNSAYKEPAS